MNKRKLNYRFHNPNPADVTADFLLKMLIEANSEKVERAIQEAASKCEEHDEYIVEPKKTIKKSENGQGNTSLPISVK